MSTVSLFFGFLSILVKHVLGIAETFGTMNSVSLNPFNVNRGIVLLPSKFDREY
jgi:hypothetical protein